MHDWDYWTNLLFYNMKVPPLLSYTIAPSKQAASDCLLLTPHLFFFAFSRAAMTVRLFRSSDTRLPELLRLGEACLIGAFWFSRHRGLRMLRRLYLQHYLRNLLRGQTAT